MSRAKTGDDENEHEAHAGTVVENDDRRDTPRRERGCRELRRLILNVMSVRPTHASSPPRRNCLRHWRDWRTFARFRAFTLTLRGTLSLPVPPSPKRKVQNDRQRIPSHPPQAEPEHGRYCVAAGRVTPHRRGLGARPPAGACCCRSGADRGLPDMRAHRHAIRAALATAWRSRQKPPIYHPRNKVSPIAIPVDFRNACCFLCTS